MDKYHVSLIVEAVKSHATDYFSTQEPDTCQRYFKGGKAFFAVYGIGGNVTKQGNRPDIDLMLVTNMRYLESPFIEDVHNHDVLTKAIADHVVHNLNLKVMGTLPDNYNLGSTKGKSLLELNPTAIGPTTIGKKIDLIYVRSMVNHGTSADLPESGESWGKMDEETKLKYAFQSEEEFCARVDVDEQQRPLPKAVLWRAKTNDFIKRQREWGP